MGDNSDTKTSHKRTILQVRRLERLIDVVFAIVIWRIFMLIPRPAAANWKWDAIGPFLYDNIMTFVLALIAVLLAGILFVVSVRR